MSAFLPCPIKIIIVVLISQRKIIKYKSRVLCITISIHNAFWNLLLSFHPQSRDFAYMGHLITLPYTTNEIKIIFKVGFEIVVIQDRYPHFFNVSSLFFWTYSLIEFSYHFIFYLFSERNTLKPSKNTNAYIRNC